MTRWYQFHARKALFEVPKSRIYIFGLKMTPPPLKVFLKFICFGAVTRFTTSELHPSRFCPFFLHSFVFQCTFLADSIISRDSSERQFTPPYVLMVMLLLMILMLMKMMLMDRKLASRDEKFI